MRLDRISEINLFVMGFARRRWIAPIHLCVSRREVVVWQLCSPGIATISTRNAVIVSAPPPAPNPNKVC